MRVLSLFTIALSVLAPLAVVAEQPAPPPAPAVKVGQHAPDFTLHYLARGANGKYEQKTMSLGEFKGRKSVILAFFPAAFSPG
jgi:hypothetical protein